MKFKKISFCAAAAAIAAAMTSTAIAADNMVLKVNGQVIDTASLPTGPYMEDTVVMVPLRCVSEALGYKVDWNSENGEITVDDDYIQKAYLKNGSADIRFEGKLKVIDMSRELSVSQEAVIIDGYTYVPSDFFIEFINDVNIDDSGISIAPSMVYVEDQITAE